MKTAHSLTLCYLMEEQIMKRCFAILLAFFLLFALVYCTSTEGDGEEETTTQQTTTTKKVETTKAVTTTKAATTTKKETTTESNPLEEKMEITWCVR